MKLLQQVCLVFTRGASEKVYEVDLCQLGNDQYVVNFRYGRRGGVLKDGSKTPLPVSRTEAERIYSKLVNGKREQGYREDQADSQTPAPTPTSTPTPTQPEPEPVLAVTPETHPRERAILERLAAGDRVRQSATVVSLTQRIRRRFRRTRTYVWPLERAIWRAGELNIAAAEPMLLNLLGTAGALRDYCIVWALGRCGSERSIASLRALYDNPKTPEHVRRITSEALLQLYSEDEKTRFLDSYKQKLPSELSAALQNDALDQALDAYLTAKPKQASVLEKLYRLDDPTHSVCFTAILIQGHFETTYAPSSTSYL